MEVLLVAVIAVAVIGLSFHYSAQAQKEREAREATWSAFAERAGLSFSSERHEVTGEHQGVRVRLRMEPRDVGGSDKVPHAVLGAEVLEPLPDGFVAAPRAWTGVLDRALASNLLRAEDLALDDCFLFQSDRPQEGQWLLNDPDAREALRGLGVPRAVGFVERRTVAVAWKHAPEDPEHLHQGLDAVVRAVESFQAASQRARRSGAWLPD